MSDDQKPERGFMQIGDLLGGLFAQVDAAQPPTATPEPDTTPAKEGRKDHSSNAQLVKAAADIAARPDKSEAAYVARELVQCTLPHRNPGKVEAWVRRNGDLSLVLQPGFDAKTMQSFGLPYGELPRLLLLWIITEAVRTKSPEVHCGGSLNAFLRDVGCDPETGGGKRGDAARAKEQMNRLFNCRVSFQYSEGNAQKGHEARLNMEVTASSQFWWDFKRPEQGGLFESKIILGDAFFKAVVANPVPIDLRVVIALKNSLRQSSFALDLYTWATYRVFKMQQKGQREISIPLQSLKEQFGAEYTRFDHFKAAFVEALTNVQQIYPALNFTIEKNILVLRDSTGRPAMPRRGQKRTPALNLAEGMSQKVSPKVRDRFTKRYPLHNIETALADFYEWRDNREIKSENADAHFWDFVKNHYFTR